MVFGANTERAIAALSKVASIWQARLDGDWVPPAGSPFPWAQVRLSLAALLPGMRDARGWVERATLGAPSAPNTGGAGASATLPVDVSVRNDLFHEEVSPVSTPAPPVLGARGAPNVTLILAGNTPLLAWSPLSACLLAGVTTVRVKLSRDETVWTHLFVESLREADTDLAERIELYDVPGEDERTYALLQDADAVIAYGSDAAVEAIRARAPKGVPFFGYGHAVSVGIAEHSTIFAPERLSGFATDTSLYDQQGCLSPHILYITGSLRHSTPPRRVDLLSFGGRMRYKMRDQCDVLPTPTAGGAVRVREARDIALFSGQTVYGNDDLRWTVIASQEPLPYPAPVGHKVLYVSPVGSPQQLRELLQPVWGIVSCAGVDGELEEGWETVLREAGVSRICKPGEMQTPPLDWSNGNRDLLAELLKKINATC